MSEQLKPCKHCNGDGLEYSNSELGSKVITYGVHCHSCPYGVKDCATEQEAIEAWNRREGNE